jgi:hypothetical protein
MIPKAKYIWQQTKYTFVRGFKDIWRDWKWLVNLRFGKSAAQLTAHDLKERSRIRIDFDKFIPYSLFLVVPFSSLALPLYLYLFPNSVPTTFQFDTDYEKKCG